MSDLNGINEEEVASLAEKSQEGDQDAFGELYDIFADSIYRYIYFRVSDDEAEDLLETVFIKVWENIKQYNKDKSSFRSWLFRIAHNLVVDYYRLNKSVQELNDNYADSRTERHPVKMTENVLNSKVLAKALKKIKKNYAQFLVLKFVNDLSNTEIAAALKKSEGSLRIIQYRALKQLRKVLVEMGATF